MGSGDPRVQYGPRRTSKAGTAMPTLYVRRNVIPATLRRFVSERFGSAKKIPADILIFFNVEEREDIDIVYRWAYTAEAKALTQVHNDAWKTAPQETVTTQQLRSAVKYNNKGIVVAQIIDKQTQRDFIGALIWSIDVYLTPRMIEHIRTKPIRIRTFKSVNQLTNKFTLKRRIDERANARFNFALGAPDVKTVLEDRRDYYLANGKPVKGLAKGLVLSQRDQTEREGVRYLATYSPASAQGFHEHNGAVKWNLGVINNGRYNGMNAVLMLYAPHDELQYVREREAAVQERAPPVYKRLYNFVISKLGAAKGNDPLTITSVLVRNFAEHSRAIGEKAAQVLRRYAQGVEVLEAYIREEINKRGPPAGKTNELVAYFNKAQNTIVYHPYFSQGKRLDRSNVTKILAAQGFTPDEASDIIIFIIQHEELHQINPAMSEEEVLSIQAALTAATPGVEVVLDEENLPSAGYIDGGDHSDNDGPALPRQNFPIEGVAVEGLQDLRVKAIVSMEKESGMLNYHYEWPIADEELPRKIIQEGIAYWFNQQSKDDKLNWFEEHGYQVTIPFVFSAKADTIGYTTRNTIHISYRVIRTPPEFTQDETYNKHLPIFARIVISDELDHLLYPGKHKSRRETYREAHSRLKEKIAADEELKEALIYVLRANALVGLMRITKAFHQEIMSAEELGYSPLEMRQLFAGRSVEPAGMSYYHALLSRFREGSMVPTSTVSVTAPLPMRPLLSVA